VAWAWKDSRPSFSELLSAGGVHSTTKEAAEKRLFVRSASLRASLRQQGSVISHAVTARLEAVP
jgi:hypothetical protein